MTISDGYGDLEDNYGAGLPNDEVVKRYVAWAHVVARKICEPHSPMYDDVVQEALIEVWRILEVKGGKVNVTAGYLTMGAKRRMRDVAWGERPMYGGDRKPGPKTEAITVPGLGAIQDDGDDVLWLDGLLEDLGAAGALESVTMAYHHGEILQALAGLSEAHRAYVHRRFWEGKGEREIAREMGMAQQSLNYSWIHVIRPQLAMNLEHLRSAV